MSQPKYYAVNSAAKTYTYAAIANATAILASGAPTAVTPQTFSGGTLNGSADSGARSAAGLPFEQAITATTSAHSGSYKIGVPNAIVVNGVAEDGSAITDSILLTAVNGGETISTTKGFAKVTSIVVPGQNDTAGAFTFGVGDIVLANPIRQLRAGIDGNVKVAYEGGVVDTMALVATEKDQVLARRIYDVGTTALPLRVYA
jgi:hypothetical protein